MEIPSLNEAEIACVKKLAELFGKGEGRITSWVSKDENGNPVRHGLDNDVLGLPSYQRIVILQTMEGLGLISDGELTSFKNYRVTPKAVQLARAIEAKEKETREPRDIVKETYDTVRGHRILAWVLIAFFVLTATATFINQTISTFQNLGWMAKPKSDR